MHRIARIVKSTAVIAAAAVMAACGASNTATNTATDAAAKNENKVTQAEFGKMPDGQAITIYTLTNASGMQARIINLGGAVVSLNAPGRDGQMADVVLGFDSLPEYVANPTQYFGAIIGRYGNRIGNASFSLNGVKYQLPKNDGQNTLHGGPNGFFRQVWAAQPLSDGGLELSYTSKDGEEGFPGNLSAKVTYHLTDANELKIDYAATTDKDTVVNLTNHSYFNLKGAGSGDVLGHVLTLNADRFTPVDRGLIPTGEQRDVTGTAFDFRKPTPIGERIEQKDQQLIFGKGYDHNWVLNKTGDALTLAARVEEPTSGRWMEVYTTEPGVQFYSGNFLSGIKGKGGKTYERRGALCLETQHFPDSPNKPKFPSTVLKPGQQYRSATIYKFGR